MISRKRGKSTVINMLRLTKKKKQLMRLILRDLNYYPTGNYGRLIMVINLKKEISSQKKKEYFHDLLFIFYIKFINKI